MHSTVALTVCACAFFLGEQAGGQPERQSKEQVFVFAGKHLDQLRVDSREIQFTDEKLDKVLGIKAKGYSAVVLTVNRNDTYVVESIKVAATVDKDTKIVTIQTLDKDHKDFVPFVNVIDRICKKP